MPRDAQFKTPDSDLVAAAVTTQGRAEEVGSGPDTDTTSHSERASNVQQQSSAAMTSSQPQQATSAIANTEEGQRLATLGETMAAAEDEQVKADKKAEGQVPGGAQAAIDSDLKIGQKWNTGESIFENKQGESVVPK